MRFTDDAGNPETLTSAATVPVAPKPNSPAGGAPTISGTAQVGETLTADTTGISDADGLTNASYSYQWVGNDGTADTDITGATGATYTLVAADEGNTIKVLVSFTDDAGNPETLTSAATAPVASKPNSPAGGAPIISGTVQVGETLTADTSGVSDPDGLTGVAFSYQWVSNDGAADVDISGATGSAYTLVAADEGSTIKVRVNFTDDAGNPEALTSAATAAVAAKPVESLWSAELTVADYGNGSLGAYDDDTLISNVKGSLQLRVKWLWYLEPERKLYLAFREPIAGAQDWMLHVDDLALDFPSGDSNFTFRNVDVSWTLGQVVNVNIVRRDPP